MTFWMRLFCIAVFFFGFFIRVDAMASTPVHDPVTQLNYVIPDEWMEVESLPYAKTLSYLDGVATFNIKIFTFSEPVTINGFHERLRTAHYDGWVNLLERPGTDYEASRAQLHESFVSVYAKTVLQPDLSVGRILAGDYYYLSDSGLKGYSLSFETNQTRWPDIREAVKSIVDSFWVGEGSRPVVIQKTYFPDDWASDSITPMNLSYVDAPLLMTPLTPTWHVEILATHNIDLSTVDMLVVGGTLVTGGSNFIQAYSLETGTKNWSVYLENQTQSAMVSNRHELIYIAKSLDDYQLVCLELDSGELRYAIELSSKQFSDPVLFSNKLAILDGKWLRVFNVATGELVWKEKGKFDVDIGLVADQTKLIAVEGSELVCYQGLDGKRLFSQKLPDPLILPAFLMGDSVVLVQENIDNTGEVFLRRYLTSDQTLVWERKFDRSQMKFDLNPVAGPDLIALFFLEDFEASFWLDTGLVNVLAVDFETGEDRWISQIELMNVVRQSPYFTRDGLVLTRGVGHFEHYFALDLQTGAPIAFPVSTHLKQLSSVRFVKNSLLVEARSLDSVIIKRYINVK